MRYLEKYHVIVEQRVKESKTKKKSKKSEVEEPNDDTESAESVKILWHAWLDLFKFLLSFKKIYETPDTKGADNYFKNDLKNVLQNKSKNIQFPDIEELQEFILQKFIHEKLIIILVRVVMDYELAWNWGGRHIHSKIIASTTYFRLRPFRASSPPVDAVMSDSVIIDHRKVSWAEVCIYPPVYMRQVSLLSENLVLINIGKKIKILSSKKK